MPFDDKTRNRLARFVTDARELIRFEFTEQLQQVYGVSATGDITTLTDLRDLDEEHLALAEVLRERINYLKVFSTREKNPAAAAVDRLTREQAFTVLNRLAAIRMAEKRGFIVESVGRGYQSKGFQVYCQVAGSGLRDAYHRYRRYLFCLFDELASDLGSLFDRRSPTSLLFPREGALLKLFGLINAPEIDELWAEDETVGWIYQYYNDEAERKRMREASAAPRDSRELAVRNQFFTPRYVVEFLVDNTLGRIWYEMTRGDTIVKERCHSLVLRPSEVFLDSGQNPPSDQKAEGLSQEDLFRLPRYIPHRPIQDPRELRLLDPACGSMHFGIYAFDLLEVIYDESWHLSQEGRIKPPSPLKPLHETYTSKEDFRKDVPRLIIENNIHGVDIDPRAVQIAGLSLWLRAQKSWKMQDISLEDRPPITRSQIACAEPMPGNPDLLKEFAQGLHPPILGQFLQKIFEKMQLAGEAGPLLKIEEDISQLVRDAKLQWQKGPVAEQVLLFADVAKPTQETFRFDQTGVTDEQFWQTVERKIYEALRSYAESAQARYSQRLFSDDATRGFAFIDLCRKRYDLILMNPPFGSPAEAFVNSKDLYPHSGRDIYGMFVERANSLRSRDGLIGAILPRTGLFIGTMSNLRREYYLGRSPLNLLLDLGKDVLDGATIRTSCYILGESLIAPILCIRVGNVDHREDKIHGILESLLKAEISLDCFIRDPRYFASIPNSAIAYWIPGPLATRLAGFGKLEAIADVRQGIATGDNFRFLRLLTELAGGHEGFSYYSKGGEPVPFVSNESLYVRSAAACIEMKANASQEYGSASRTIKNEDTFGLPGITYSQVNDACLKFRIHPPNALYDMKGPVLFGRDGTDREALLAFLNSAAVEDFMRMMTDGRQWHVSALKAVPTPKFEGSFVRDLAQYAKEAALVCQLECSRDESGHYFSFGQNFRNAEGEMSSLQTLEERTDNRVWAAYGASEADVLSIQRQRLLFLERSVSRQPRTDTVFSDMASLALGSALGRWDIRFATGEKPTPKMPDPFDTLPICSPGMLQNEKGMPLTRDDMCRLDAAGKWDYPLEVSWEGILVDDAGHQLDIETRVRRVLEIVWKDSAEGIEQDAYESLGYRSLRDYFRKPTGFFDDHLRRYSKSRRQAPIYWPLSTRSGGYNIWLYYPRLSTQTLHACLADFVDPKLKNISEQLRNLRQSNNSQTRLDEISDFKDELQEMRTEIERLIKLPYEPNLNDGVLITACPLWKLFRLSKWQKDLKSCWQELESGEYDWSHLAHSIWPDRVREKCRTDLSIAIAHGLEHLCAVEEPKPKAKRGRKIEADLVEEDTI